MTDLLLGIDPGQRSGYAVVTVSRNPDLIDCGTINLKNTSCVMSIDELEEDHGAINHIAIEDQYVGKKNLRSVIVLARGAGRWHEAAEYNGLHVYWINPKSWQSRELDRGSVLRKSTKVASIGKVKGVYKISVNEHEADAILIARYCAIGLAQ